MKVETNTLSPCRMRVVVKADPDETRQDYERVLGEYVAHSRIRGFRVGKAPTEVVLRTYRQDIDQDVRQRLIGRFFPKAIEEKKLAIANFLGFSDVVFSPETGITFAMTVDVEPDFKLPKYEGIAVKAEDATVGADKIDGQIDRMRDMAARFEDAKEGETVGKGDLVQLDFEARIGDRPLSEFLGGEDPRNLGAGADRWFQVDPSANAYIPGLMDGVKGMAPGETRAIPVSFPDDYPVEALRKQTADYSTTVKRIHKRQPVDEADFLRQYGAETLDALRERVAKGMQESADRQETARRRQVVIDHLLKKTEFDLPQSLVEAETDAIIRDMLQDASGRGMPIEEIEKHREEFLGTASSSARDRVRLRYILARIAEEERVEETDEDLETRIREMAAQYRMDAAQLRAMLEERNAIESIRDEIRANKVLDLLLEKARIS
ncbi:MAG: trigger factor [Kiritimatiellia bacterium]|jgi:trigger factor